MILSDRDILAGYESGLIVMKPERKPQPASVDLHLGSFFKVFKSDVRDYDFTTSIEEVMRTIYLEDTASLWIHPRQFILGVTEEYIELSDSIVGKLDGKSSLGRLGLIVHATAGFVDPGFKGKLVLEISNLSQVALKLMPHMPIAQISFTRTSSPVLKLYGDPELGSHYQDQSISGVPEPSMLWQDYLDTKTN